MARISLRMGRGVVSAWECATSWLACVWYKMVGEGMLRIVAIFGS